MSGTTGELPTMTPQLGQPELADLLRRRVAGEQFPESHSFIHEEDAYSAAPADLVRGRAHAPGTDRGDGKGGHWFFCCPARYRENSAGRPTAQRNRTVVGGGGGGQRCWHSESKKKSIRGRDGKAVGAYANTLTYVLKTKNPPGMASAFTRKRLGWCMVEIELQQQGDQLVLCVVYRSPRADPGTSSAGAGAALPQNDQTALCSVRVPDGVSPAAGGTGSSGVSEDEDGQRGRADAAKMPSPSIDPAASEADLGKGWVLWCRSGAAAAPATAATVMKFGRSSIRSAEHMKEAAKLVLRFAEETPPPVVVLSAMGKTTTNLLLAAEKAVRWGTQQTWQIHELEDIKQLHLRTIDELGLDSLIVSGSLDELEQRLKCIAITKVLTSKARDHVVSIGERMSTDIFSAYLNKLGKEPRQEWASSAVTTIGRGGSDLTAITIGIDLGSREIRDWKDVDGLFTCDPKAFANAIPLPYMTFHEAAELGFFDAQSMQLAMESAMPVIVKNLCNPQAPGTMITKTRDMSKSILTSIGLKSNITTLNITRMGMLGQSSFVAMCLPIFDKLGTSVNCVDTSEGKISLILVPSKLWSRKLIQLNLDIVLEELQQIAAVHLLSHRSVISLIGNAEMSSFIFEKAFSVLRSINVNVQKMSPWTDSSKVMKLSLVVHDNEAERCVHALHSEFFEKGFLPEVLGVYSTAAASSGDKRKPDDEHPEAPQSVRQGRTHTDPNDDPQQIPAPSFDVNQPLGDDDYWEDLREILNSDEAWRIFQPAATPVYLTLKPTHYNS